MRATTISRSPLSRIFRFRCSLHLLIYVAAFAITWAAPARVGVQRVWLALPGLLSAKFRIDLQAAIVSVTVLAVVLAFGAAALRTWAAAYLGSKTVLDPTLRGDKIVSDGPFRYLRNPLYLGTIFHTLALSVLMSWAGAFFCLVTIVGLQLTLMRSEEQFFLQSGSRNYADYAKRVPRVIPRLTGAAGPSRNQAQWPQAFAGEIYMWGTAVSFAAFGFSYNPILVIQGVLVSFGLSIVIRALWKG